MTSCEARFVAAVEQEGQAVLVWACPVGVSAPSAEELDEVCRVLIGRGLVQTCSSPSGLTLEDSLPDLPSTT